MSAYISISDFDCWMEKYHMLRVDVLNHQPSGVEANKRDLNLFSNYLHSQNIEMITGEETLKFIGWLRVERDNNAGSKSRDGFETRLYRCLRKEAMLNI